MNRRRIYSIRGKTLLSALDSFLPFSIRGRREWRVSPGNDNIIIVRVGLKEIPLYITEIS